MAATGTSSLNLQSNPRGFMTLLSSAACEWLLIFLMFVDAAFSYLLTKFASYCKLQTPCLLCSRLDHVFGNEKPGCYWSLLCSNHRAEISSLISCHVHNRLADVREMCEECFMSFAMQNKSSSESYRLLLGKLGVDFERCGFQSPFLNKNFISGSLSTRTCSCCNKRWRALSKGQRLLQLTPVGYGASKANVKPPLPRVPGRSRLSRRDSFKKIRDKFSGPITLRRVGNTGVDTLSHVGYTELKITSDSESEVQFSDDDDRSYVLLEKNDPEGDFVEQCGSENLAKAHKTPGQQTHQASDPGPSLLDQSVQLDVPSLASYGHGFGEHNWEPPDPKPSLSALPELISFDNVPPSSYVQVPFGISAERSKPDAPLSDISSPFVLSELVSQNDVPPQSRFVEDPLTVSQEKSVDVSGTSEGHTSVTKHVQFSELLSSTTGTGFLNDAALLLPNDTDLGDVSKLAVSNKGRELSIMLAEQLAVTDSAKVEEDLKLLSPILSTHEMDLSLNTSPRAYGHHDRLQISDASSSDGVRVLQRSASLDRNDSGYESLDGSSVSEIEGESVVDRLKRQVKYDQRCMGALHKELEEERSASAVATNQAMAMITRLQEEKATLHMEALQYLRMMEEQAEYDMEALEKANDLLAEKEKEMQDLEAELEFYRNNFPDESAVENLHDETCNLNGENTTFGNNGVACIKNNANIPFESRSTMISEGSDIPIDVKTSLNFEDEKMYISQCLRKLERKLYQVSSNWASSDMPNGVYSEKLTKAVENKEVLLPDGVTRIDHQEKEKGLLMQRDLSASNGSPSELVASAQDNDFNCEQNNHFDSSRKKYSIHNGEIDLATLENEISDLNDRLEALEADCDFLEHAFNSLRNGNEGLKFIQEIAHQLQELRKIDVERRSLSVT